MSLTLNQFLFLVLTIAVVTLVTFLIQFLIQLRKTVKTGEETMKELRTLAVNLSKTSQKVSDKIDDVGEVLEATKKTAISLSEVAFFTAMRLIRPVSKVWPFLFPFIRLGWKKIKKKKEDKNV
jgi:hypothetical protein